MILIFKFSISSSSLLENVIKSDKDSVYSDDKTSHEYGWELKLSKCVGDEEITVKIKDTYSDQMADVILRGNRLRIPDCKTREMIKELS